MTEKSVLREHWNLSIQGFLFCCEGIFMFRVHLLSLERKKLSSEGMLQFFCAVLILLMLLNTVISFNIICKNSNCL